MECSIFQNTQYFLGGPAAPGGLRRSSSTHVMRGGGGGGTSYRSPVTPITTPVSNKRRAPPVSLRNMNVRGNQMIQQRPVITPPPPVNRSTNRQPGNTNRPTKTTGDVSRAPVTSKQWHTAFNQTGRQTNGQTNGQTDRMIPNRSGARRPMNGGLGNKPITPILNIR